MNAVTTGFPDGLSVNRTSRRSVEDQWGGHRYMEEMMRRLATLWGIFEAFVIEALAIGVILALALSGT
jgi:hypothetical protein